MNDYLNVKYYSKILLIYFNYSSSFAECIHTDLRFLLYISDFIIIILGSTIGRCIPDETSLGVENLM